MRTIASFIATRKRCSLAGDARQLHSQTRKVLRRQHHPSYYPMSNVLGRHARLSAYFGLQFPYKARSREPGSGTAANHRCLFNSTESHLVDHNPCCISYDIPSCESHHFIIMGEVWSQQVQNDKEHPATLINDDEYVVIWLMYTSSVTC